MFYITLADKSGARLGGVQEYAFPLANRIARFARHSVVKRQSAQEVSLRE